MKTSYSGFIFLFLGIIFLWKDINQGAMISHSNTLFFINEMTWMWFSMALIHFFLVKECNCKK
ncbi:hypothetical protein [Candidatus Pelagibacter bacterium nBUS_28]|uniref:hypothetical protein n=1 Tax=Candidatus Pelagibacter bacterium nBUS_28 TaxID=3374189 RepID=UPI003EBA3B2D